MASYPDIHCPVSNVLLLLVPLAHLSIVTEAIAHQARALRNHLSSDQPDAHSNCP